jgi:hypothetical protein
MFEKEAKEYSTSSKVDYVNNIAITLVQQAFRDGAEFGYNKAIVEIKDAYEGNGNFLAWFENYLEGKNV